MLTAIKCNPLENLKKGWNDLFEERQERLTRKNQNNLEEFIFVVLIVIIFKTLLCVRNYLEKLFFFLNANYRAQNSERESIH